MSTLSVLRQSIVIVILLLSLFVPHSVCETASSDEMDLACTNWLKQYVNQRGHWAGDTHPRILTANEIRQNDTLLARLYFISPDGFILIPTLKEMNPIKLYSENQSPELFIDNGIIDFIKSILLEKYTLFISIYGSLDAIQPQSGDGLFNQKHKRMWEVLTAPEIYQENSLDLSVSLSLDEAGPLLTSSWHQNSPYNNLCPQGDVGTCLAGCVAVAAAQIINYHQWPPHGVGSKTYYWDGDQSCGDTSAVGAELTVDLLNLYDWEHMPDNCIDNCQWQDSLALAELNYEVAVAMETNFGSCGSGVSSNFAISAYEDFFMYDSIMAIVYRDDNTYQQWFDLIKSEIDNNRPIQYFIPGHSAVCDGYRDNGLQQEMHINYGWGGPFSGWYILDSLSDKLVKPVSSDFKINDYMIINIQPETSPMLEYTGRVISDSLGDGNGHANAGDTVEIAIKAINHKFHAYDVNALLSIDDPYIILIEDTASFGDSIAWGEEKLSQTSAMIVINPICPDPYYVIFAVELVSSNGEPVTDSFGIFIGNDVGFSDDIELGEGNWVLQSVDPPTQNEWHRENYRFHSPSNSWKAGGNGADDYINNSDSRLISPYILLPERPHMSFWHYISAEINLFDSSANDGGYVMISTENDDWAIISPVGDYPFSSFGTPCFSGDYDWNKTEFNLEEYSGVVRFMLVFFSNRYEVYEGWYFDDFKVFSGVLCGDANADDIINISDVIFLVNFIFINGSDPPDPPCAADSEGDGEINISDALWNINYIFSGGNHPIPGCCD